MPGFEGLRHAKRDSPNAGWRNESFRGYGQSVAKTTPKEG